MKEPTSLAPTSLHSTLTKHAAGVAAVVIVTLVIALCAGFMASAGAQGSTGLTAAQGIFRPFSDDSGFVQSAPSNVKISTANGSVVPVPSAPLDSSNTFFDPNFGTNGQGCVTCHQPGQGFTIHVSFINDTFTASGGTDPLFRPNDTANNPNAATPDYGVFLNQGAARIGKTLDSASNFTAVAADTQTITNFGVFPLTNDPQQPGKQTLSLFRRPLVNTNVHLDSSVLWDGRASIGNMRAQVIGAAKTLLLAPNPTNDQADQVAAFMLGVYTDQVFDTAAGTDATGACTFTVPGQQCGAGLVSADGAMAGVSDLLALALSPEVPCTNFLETEPAAGGTGCIANSRGYDLFDAWATLPDSGTNAGRLAVVRGQQLFNGGAVLHVPADLQTQLGTTIQCTTCHATHNIGNNPDPNFFARVGTDSVEIVSALEATHPELSDLLSRVQILPHYCLRPKTDTSTATCGSDSGDVFTTDPGRAMVSHDIADVGKFKPPTLRGLAARSPYFHAGVAPDIQTLIHFYRARFDITVNGHPMTEDEVNDLGAFLEAQ